MGWFPFMVLCNVVSYNPIYYLRKPVIGLVHRICLYMVSMNCMVNPIIYALRFKSFRRGFKLVCSCSSDDEISDATGSVWWISWCNWELFLTHCGIVTPYGDIDLGGHRVKQWFVMHCAITETLFMQCVEYHSDAHANHMIRLQWWSGPGSGGRR